MSSARQHLTRAAFAALLAVVGPSTASVTAQQAPKSPASPPVQQPARVPAARGSAPVSKPRAATATPKRDTVPARPATTATSAPTTPKPAPSESATDPRVRWTVVTYLSGESIYLDAGTIAGMREKATADVVRRDSVVAVLEVTAVSSQRSAARLVRGSGVVVGDSVRYAPFVEPAVIATSASTTARTDSSTARSSQRPAAPRRGPRAVTGRLGLRYMSLQTGSGPYGKLTQPALDMRLEGHRIDGSPLGIVIDARAHRQRRAPVAPTAARASISRCSNIRATDSFLSASPWGGNSRRCSRRSAFSMA